jgi:sulfatase modifying factor 1
MRHLLLAWLLAASLTALAGPATAVAIDWVTVGDPGNAPDTASNCASGAPDCGSVGYAYRISKYEVTNAQYAEFLNAKAASDPSGLYDPLMDSDATFGGITQSGASGSYSYAAKVGFENEPVAFVSLWDALRFANWLHNGQGNGDTETGAYTLTVDGIASNTIARNPGATVFLPSENEWYKAAYHDPGGDYFDYPTGTDAQTGCGAPASDAGNSANCNGVVFALTDVGAYGLSVSHYGTFDQGGNVFEWNEQIVSGTLRGFRGGGWSTPAAGLAASFWDADDPSYEDVDVGFRVASVVPEPTQALLVLTGGLVLAGIRRRRR